MAVNPVYIHIKSTTVEDIYGKSLAEIERLIDKSYEIVDFRPPTLGEDFANYIYPNIVARNGSDSPRLILKRRLKKKFLIGEWEIVDDSASYSAPGTIRSSNASFHAGGSNYRIEERDV